MALRIRFQLRSLWPRRQQGVESHGTAFQWSWSSDQAFSGSATVETLARSRHQVDRQSRGRWNRSIQPRYSLKLLSHSGFGRLRWQLPPGYRETSQATPGGNSHIGGELKHSQKTISLGSSKSQSHERKELGDHTGSKETKEKHDSQMQCVHLDWSLLTNKQTNKQWKTFLGTMQKKLNIDLILDNIMESLWISLCVIMALQFSGIMLYPQGRDAEVSRSEISWCLQMCQNDNSDWVEMEGIHMFI